MRLGTCILGEINGDENSKRYCHEGHEKNKQDSAVDCGENASSHHALFRRGTQKLPTQPSSAVNKNVAENNGNHRKDNQRRDECEHHERPVECFSHAEPKSLKRSRRLYREP